MIYKNKEETIQQRDKIKSNSFKKILKESNSQNNIIDTFKNDEDILKKESKNDISNNQKENSNNNNDSNQKIDFCDGTFDLVKKKSTMINQLTKEEKLEIQNKSNQIIKNVMENKIEKSYILPKGHNTNKPINKVNFFMNKLSGFQGKDCSKSSNVITPINKHKRNNVRFKSYTPNNYISEIKNSKNTNNLRNKFPHSSTLSSGCNKFEHYGNFESSYQKGGKNINKYQNIKIHEFYINQNLKNKQFYKHKNNYISTTKYNFFTFLPKSLLIQFSRMANVYFLFTTIIQCIPVISPLTPITAIIPLCFVLFISMVREFIEDWSRRRFDNMSNNALIYVKKEGTKFIEITSQNIEIGDLILLKENQCVPCDMILIDSSKEGGICYVETSSLDGEKALKEKLSSKLTYGIVSKKLGTNVENINVKVHSQFKCGSKKKNIFDLFIKDKINKIKNLNISGFCQCDYPNPNLHKFDGKVKFLLDSTESYGPIFIKNLLLKGSIIKNTEWVIGIVIYTGLNNKIILNSKTPKNKNSKIELKLNYYLIFIFIFQIILCMICSILHSKRYKQNINFYVNFIIIQRSIELESFITFFTYLLLLNTMIPISLIVTMEIVKICLSILIKWDVDLYSFIHKKFANVSTVSLIEELGNVNYIFSDKTGTLTCNKMEFKYCVIGEKCYEYIGNNNSDIQDKRTENKMEIFENRINDSMLNNNNISKSNNNNNINENNSDFVGSSNNQNNIEQNIENDLSMSKNKEIYSAKNSDIYEDDTPIKFSDGFFKKLIFSDVVNNQQHPFSNNLSQKNCNLSSLNYNSNINLSDSSNNNNFKNSLNLNLPKIDNKTKKKTLSFDISNLYEKSSQREIMKLTNRNNKKTNNLELATNSERLIKKNESIHSSDVDLNDNDNRIKYEFWKALACAHECTVKEIEEDLDKENEKINIKNNDIIILNANNNSYSKENVIDNNNNNIKYLYSGVSPDDIELVKMANLQGFSFVSSQNGIMKIKIHNKVKDYKILKTLNFSSERKRMSIILMNKKNKKIIMYSKGADTEIFKRLNDNPVNINLIKSIKKYTEKFSIMGFRSLVIAMKILSKKDYLEWVNKLKDSEMSLTNKEKLIDKCYDEMEQNLDLLGATFVEDKLQDGVPETIKQLRLSGIKIWLLTGDKVETSENIAVSSNLINFCTEKIFRIKTFNKEEKIKYLNENSSNVSESIHNSSSISHSSFDENDGECLELSNFLKEFDKFYYSSSEKNLSFYEIENNMKLINNFQDIKNLYFENSDEQNYYQGKEGNNYNIHQCNHFKFNNNLMNNNKIPNKTEENVNNINVNNSNSNFLNMNDSMKKIMFMNHLFPNNYKIYYNNLSQNVSNKGSNLSNSDSSSQNYHFSILIESQVLAKIISNPISTKKFLKIAMEASTVICCRVSPLQKSQVIKIVKNYNNDLITLAVGDGGNDVSMIREANIGIGIYGNEGLRAVQSADFSIGEFKFLGKLILFHGKVNMNRITNMILYFFYKNFTFTIMHFYYSFYNLSSGQTVIDDWFISLYNLLFTAFPLAVQALTDFDLVLSDGKLVKDMIPFLYKESRNYPVFNKTNFLFSLLRGFFCSIFCIIIINLSFKNYSLINSNGHQENLWYYSLLLYSCIICVVTINLSIKIKYIVIHFPIITLTTSIGLYIAFCFYVNSNIIFNSNGTMNIAFSSPIFYLNMILVCGTSFIIDYSLEAFKFLQGKLLSVKLMTLINKWGKQISCYEDFSNFHAMNLPKEIVENIQKIELINNGINLFPEQDIQFDEFSKPELRATCNKKDVQNSQSVENCKLGEIIKFVNQEKKNQQLHHNLTNKTEKQIDKIIDGKKSQNKNNLKKCKSFSIHKKQFTNNSNCINKKNNKDFSSYVINISGINNPFTS